MDDTAKKYADGLASCKTVDEAVLFLKKNNHGYKMRAVGFGPEALLMRCRIFPKKVLPENISDLSYPPDTLVSKNGRANRAGCSVFYAASNLFTAIEEVQPKIGDTLYVSYWWIRHPMHSVVIGFTEEALKKINPEIDHKKFLIHEDYHKHSAEDPRTSVIYDIFTSSGDGSYGGSVAIAEHFFTPCIVNSSVGMRNTYVDEQGRLSKVIDALIYPTIRNKGNGLNFAIQPKFIDNSVSLARIDGFEVVSTSPYGIKPIRYSNYNDSGKIEWVENGRYGNWAVNTTEGPIFLFKNNEGFHSFHSRDGFEVSASNISKI